jgi:hypothetical protein
MPSIRFGFSPVRHARISTNARGHVRLGVGAHHGPWSITTGKTLSQGSTRRARRRYSRTHNATGATIKPAQRTWPWVLLSVFLILVVAGLFAPSSPTVANKPTLGASDCKVWNEDLARNPAYICVKY